MSKETNDSGGVLSNFGTVVQIILIGLKLFGFIDWSWKVVLIPFWISAILLVSYVITHWSEVMKAYKEYDGK